MLWNYFDKKDISAHVVGCVDVRREWREGKSCFVADVQAHATHTLAELWLDAYLQQIVLEQHAIVLTNEPEERVSYLVATGSLGGGLKVAVYFLKLSSGDVNDIPRLS